MGYILYATAFMSSIIICAFNFNLSFGASASTLAPSAIASSMVQYAGLVDKYVRNNPGVSGSATLTELGIATGPSCLATCWKNVISNNQGFIYPVSSQYVPLTQDISALGGLTILYGTTVGTSQLKSINFGMLFINIPASIPSGTDVIVVQ